MKRLGGLWPQVIAFDNLYLAYRAARLGKANRPGVSRFALNLERELLALQSELISGAYQPGPYRLFTVYERKPRLIAAAPFRDRVVHHALMRVIEPPLDRRFIFDSYACRQDKGVHRAVDRYQGWARRYAYVLKLDVARYFPSIDHARLKAKLAARIMAARIKDSAVLGLLGRIIDTSPPTDDHPLWFPGDDLLTPLERAQGIPIGNLTSQFFANLYLDDFDHWLKEEIRTPAYLRYVDDMVVLGDDTAALRDLRDAIRERLAGERLRLHPRKAEISRTGDGLDLLGYRVFPDFRRLRADNGHRFARHLRALATSYAAGRIAWAAVDAGVQSWIGHASHADTLGLRRAIFRHSVFRRGAGRTTPSG